MCAIQLAFAVIAILTLVALFALCAPQRSTFVSGEATAVHKVTNELYKNNSDVSYSTFKVAVDPVYNADVALYQDTQSAYKSDPQGYTREKVENCL